VLSISSESHDFGVRSNNEVVSTTFEILNSGEGNLEYSLNTNDDWISVDPKVGDSSGEADIITVEINTLGLSDGMHTGLITIESNGGEETFEVKVNVSSLAPPPDDGYISITFPKKLSFSCIKAEIKNADNETISRLNWTVDVTGGIFERVNKTTEGYIEAINSNETKEISTKIFIFDFKSKIFGLGKINVKIELTNKNVKTTASKECLVIGPIIYYCK